MLGDSVRRRQPHRRGDAPTPRRATKTDRPWWRPVIIAVAIALVVPFAVGYLLAVFVVFPPAEHATSGIAVPDLVGHSAEEAQRELAAAGLGPVEVTEMPHPTAAAGLIVAQSPLPGQQLRAGASVVVALSAGEARAVIPDVIGFGADRAESLLRRAGFEVERLMQESPAAPGRVIRTDPEPAQVRPLSTMVTLVVSSGLPPSEPDTVVDEPPDR
ncbi:MAG TPA: PASTA domain-containing protein [Longimicrobiales bacterium]|nr:PASTA domain-containing protein [Longimicrobiales bacterium]